MNKLLDEVLKKIKPSKEEISKVNIILDNIVNKIKISKAKVELGGSGAKDTWLSNTNDIDVYVKFDFKNYNNKDISSILEK